MIVSLDVAPQDFEMDLPDPGDQLELVRSDTLLPYGTGTVLQVFWDGISRQAELELSGDFMPQAAVGDLLTNRSKAARLVFEDNTAENIRGRRCWCRPGTPWCGITGLYTAPGREYMWTQRPAGWKCWASGISGSSATASSLAAMAGPNTATQRAWWWKPNAPGPLWEFTGESS